MTMGDRRMGIICLGLTTWQLGSGRSHDPHMTDDLFHILDGPRMVGDPFEFEFVLGDADEIDYAVDRLDIVVERPDVPIEQQLGAKLGADPGIQGEIEQAARSVTWISLSTSVTPSSVRSHTAISSARFGSARCTVTYEPNAPWCTTYGSVMGQMTVWLSPNINRNTSST